jgi:iron complex outermembrane receptor protein
MKKTTVIFAIALPALILSGLNAFAKTTGTAAENAAASAPADKTATTAGNTITAASAGVNAEAAAAIATTVSAAANKAQYELEDVVITGTKTRLKVKDSPAAVEVVTKDNFSKSKQVINIDDALTNLPGVQVERTAKGGQSIVLTLRGFPDYTRSLVLLDGFDIQNPNNRRPFWQQVPVNLVDRVEVIKGPFSALYGKNAEGGVINIITKEPEGRSLNFSSTYDSTNIRVSSVDFSDRPFDQFGYFIGYENEYTDGYTVTQYIQKSPVTGTTATKVDGAIATTDTKGNLIYNIGQSPRTQIETNSASGKFYYSPSRDHKISLLLDYSRWDQPTNKAFVGKTFLTDHTTGNPVSNGTVQIYGTNELVTLTQSNFFVGQGYNAIWSGTIDYEGKINDALSLSGGVEYKNGPLKHTIDTIAANATAFSGTGSSTSDCPNDIERILNAKAYLTLGQHYLTIGVNNDNSFNTCDTATYTRWWDSSQETVTVHQNQRSQENINSGYVQDQWKILQPLTGYLGARLDNWTLTDGRYYDTYLLQYVNVPDRTENIVSPKISFVYRPFEELSFRVSAGRTFNPPPEIDLFTFSYSTTSETIPNQNLKPEIDDAWEIGGEFTLPIQTTLSATYFQNYITDFYYSNSTIAGGFTTTQWENAERAQINGIEAELKQPLLPFLSAFGSYTFLDSEIVKNSYAPITIGKQIPNIAKQYGVAGLDFSWNGFKASFTEVFSSKIYTLAGDVDTVNGVQGSYDPYAVSNIQVSYGFNGGKVSFGIDDITDLKYFTQYQNTGRTYNFGINFSVL